MKILSGVGVDAAGSIISMAVGLLVIPFFFHYISKDQYGLWLAISGLVALISVLDVGTDQYLTTVISNDNEFFSTEIGNQILSTLIVKIAITSVFICIGVVLYLFIANLLAIDPSSLDAARHAFLISLFVLVFTLFAGTISTLLYSRHHFALVSGMASFSSILASIGTIVFLSFGFEISAFPLALLFALTIQYAVLAVFMLRRYPHVSLRFKGFKFQNTNGMISYSVSFQMLRWFHTLRTQYVTIAINNLVGPGATAVYNLTNRLPQLITLFSSKIALPFFPLFAEQMANDDLELVARTFVKVNKFLFRFSLFAAVVCFVVTKAFVTAWIGATSFAGSSALLVLCTYTFVIAAMGSFGIVIYSSKKFEKWTLVSVIEIVCAVALSYALSLKFGLVGVLAGFSVASMINQIYLYRIVLRQLHISSREFVSNVVAYALRTNLTTLLAAIIVLAFVEVSGWLELFFTCSCFCLLHLISNEGYAILKSKQLGFKARLLSAFKL